MKETITHNLTKAESQGLHQLKKDQNLKILPADKGNATVIMDKEDYEKNQRPHLDWELQQITKRPNHNCGKKDIHHTQEIQKRAPR